MSNVQIHWQATAFLSWKLILPLSVRLACRASKGQASKSPATPGSPAGGENRFLRRGLLVEFEKENNRKTLAAVQKPDGKKNWMTQDQVCVNTTALP